MRQIVYYPTPTAEKFHADDSFVRAVMGPVGSGKSVMCVLELLKRAMAQHPNASGVRKSRWAVIRATYPMLKTTTIKTFSDWIPSEMCRITYGSPIRGMINCMLPDNTVLEAEVIFLALDKAQDAEKLKSLELTGAFMNEASELNPRILEVLKGRVGRYPAAKDGGWSWKGIWIDSNPPPTRSWFYKLFEEQRPESHRIYKQPSPLIYDPINQEYFPNPDAENVAGHIPAGGTYIDGYRYWLDQIPGNSQDVINTLILGQYGAVYDGRPVYTSFSEWAHVAKTPVHGDRRFELVIGFDFGLMPAAVFTQMDNNGTLTVLDECVGEDVTLDEFMDNQVMPLIRKKYSGYQIIFVGDPAGRQRSDRTKTSSFHDMRQRGLKVKAASTNSIVARIRAVEFFLNRRSKFLLFKDNCIVLHEGFCGGYRYDKQNSAELGKNPTPAKTEFSHPHDALQYASLYHYKDFLRSTRTRDHGQYSNTRNRHSYA